jgi:hypothetical protein
VAVVVLVVVTISMRRARERERGRTRLYGERQFAGATTRVCVRESDDEIVKL